MKTVRARSKAEQAEIVKRALTSPVREPDPLDTLPGRAIVVDEVRDDNGMLRAVKLCSFFLGAHLWVLIDPSFFPPDDDPVFFSDELAFLTSKSREELEEILKVKRVFPRCRVVQ